MKLLILVLLVVFTLSNISALCNQTQINLNNANVTGLDKLDGIGPVKAQGIIDSRPFYSVEDLINVKGIGNVTLTKIKIQGLACVDSETELIVRKENSTNISSVKITNSTQTKTQETNVEVQKTVAPEVIKLNPKDIKTGANFENLYSNKILWLTAFLILIVFLLLVKKYRTKKNEF